MQVRTLWLLATLALVSCGGSQEPAADAAGEAADSAAELSAGADAELLANDGAEAPTTGRFEMGVNYMRLSPTQPTSSNPDQVEVCEVFWYGCPHCFNFDPYVKRWLESKPADVSFVRVPAVWNPLLRLHARAFYTAEELGKGAEMHDAFFSEIHERQNGLDSEAKLQEFFGRFGVDAATFKRTFDSFAVQAKLQHADELSRRYRIQSVPTIVVNGKYTTGGGDIANFDELIALVDELVAAERARK